MPERAPPPVDAIARNRIRDAEIRAAYALGGITMNQLARRYRLTDSRIWQIVRRPRKQPGGHDRA